MRPEGGVGGKLADTLIVEALCDKYIEHQPIARPCTRFERAGEQRPARRGASEPRHTRPCNRALQHGELVSEQGDLGEQRSARAKRGRQGGGGTRTASRTSAKVTPTPSTSR